MILFHLQWNHPTKEQICEIEYSSIKKNDKEIQIGRNSSNARKIREFVKRNSIKILNETETKNISGYRTYHYGSLGTLYSNPIIDKIYYFTFSTDDINIITDFNDIES